jgi:hypothetical protein
VRDIGELSTLAEKVGLTLIEAVPMPANNMIVAFAPTTKGDVGA